MHEQLRAWLYYLHQSAVNVSPASTEAQTAIFRDRLTTNLNNPAVLRFYSFAQELHTQWARQAVSDYEGLTHDQINQYWHGPESVSYTHLTLPTNREV